jgi:hypothetical protein
MTAMQMHRDNEAPALWLAPLAATLPLIPLFSLPSSPLFLGKLMGNPMHPFLWPRLGPWLAAMAVVFDGTLLGYFTLLLVALPFYLVFKTSGKASAFRVLILFTLAGACASQFVAAVQGFRQPLLRDFAVSWLSPLIGCLCGLVAGTSFALFANRRLSRSARGLVYSLPVAMIIACGSALVWSAKVWRAH